MLSPEPAEIASDQKARSDEQTSFQVDVSSLVILPESQSSHGSQKRRQRRPLGLVLVHVEEINQHRNNQDAAANTDDPGKHTYHQAKQYVEKSHGRNDSRKQRSVEIENVGKFRTLQSEAAVNASAK